MFVVTMLMMLSKSSMFSCSLPTGCASGSGPRLLVNLQRDGEIDSQVQLVMQWQQAEDKKSLEGFLIEVGDQFLRLEQNLKKEVEKQDASWKGLSRFPIPFEGTRWLFLGDLEPNPKAPKTRRRSCKDLTAHQVSKVLEQLQDCWKAHKKTLPEHHGLGELPNLGRFLRGSLHVDPTLAEERAQVLSKFFDKNMKWREKWEHASVPACVKRALRKAKAAQPISESVGMAKKAAAEAS